MEAGYISDTDYMVYSPWTGCWTRANIFNAQRFEANTFIIYRPADVDLRDSDFPGLSTVVRKLHYLIAAMHPDEPMPRIPRRYRTVIDAAGSIPRRRHRYRTVIDVDATGSDDSTTGSDDSSSEDQIDSDNYDYEF